ncbi:hypothetical protein FF38_13403 [Lucilia cuprina]|uniref:Uncharacterized protein n=1 Tax=Lucilia cuprina TaxID=7375 RepID=A0A0L0CA12_LUCCU|nr:hypothetical protein FF38_13403 [Lucilia cuprina]
MKARLQVTLLYLDSCFKTFNKTTTERKWERGTSATCYCKLRNLQNVTTDLSIVYRTTARSLSSQISFLFSSSVFISLFNSVFRNSFSFLLQAATERYFGPKLRFSTIDPVCHFANKNSNAKGKFDNNFNKPNTSNKNRLIMGFYPKSKRILSPALLSLLIGQQKNSSEKI